MAINLEQAAQSKFESSTLDELREYATQLGVTFAPTENSNNLRMKLLRELGEAPQTERTNQPNGPANVRVTTTAGGSEIFPPYNLSPNGIWGGRRHRIKLPRPEGSKLAKAEPFAWNGKHPFYIPYDEVVSVPEPIFQILATNKRRRPVQKRIPMPDGTVEITTAWEFDDLNFSYFGVDPNTEGRAGSMLEWYQGKGSAWFADRTVRQLQLIAGRMELPVQVTQGAGVPPRQYTKEELLGRLNEFLYGYPDAVAEPAEAA